MYSTNKDLTVSVDDGILNVRVAVLLETPNGFIFSKSKEGYWFTVGGRIKWRETAEEAAARELFEELRLQNVDFQFIGMIENFFIIDDGKECHEINFVYKATYQKNIDLNAIKIDNGGEEYICVKAEDFDKYDIRPKAVLKIIKSGKPFLKLVNDDIGDDYQDQK